MKWKNTNTNWGMTTQLFHWGMFLLIVIQYSIAYAMTNFPDSDQKWALYGWHKQLGLTLLILVFFRLWWREVSPVPKDSPKAPGWARVMSKINIWAMYGLLFIFPLSGLLMSILGGHSVNYFDLFTIPAFMEGPNIFASSSYSLHIWSAYLLLIFIALHILGGIYHHYFIKDDVLLRMLPQRE